MHHSSLSNSPKTAKMFSKILIANRGEIACRIIKTAKKMGILTVAVYSDADANALHVKMADEAVYLGGSPSRESYLLADKVIAAAKKTGAEAIHPGYGFLSENAEFCQACAQENIVFIGPPVSAIEAMGSKSAAKNIMEKAKVPLVPGYHGEDQSEAVIKKAADEMGYPVLLKATAGGGGKGMRQIWNETEFSEGFLAVKREAKSSFGDDTMLVEKYLTQPRHVEIQVFCDNHGNAVYLFERDCSVQRRHQKVIEEAPAFNMTNELREKMGESAIKSAKAIGYQGAGTVEFLLDVDGSFYFMEMNTRLQVEHPVTELITGQDLVEWQLNVAAGEPLPKKQDELTIHGHAFEARIYAEDTENDFLPSTGKLTYLCPPAESKNVRVDTGVQQDDEVSVFYDPMIAKLIVWDESREKALKRLASALLEYKVSGVTTNIDFLYNLATSKPFINEDIDTSFIDKNHDDIFHVQNENIENELAIVALHKVLSLNSNAINQIKTHSDPYSPWNMANAWRLNASSLHTFILAHRECEFPISVEQETNLAHTANTYKITVADQVYLCSGIINGDSIHATINGVKSHATVVKNKLNITIFTLNGAFNFALVEPDYGHSAEDAQAGLIAPMNGTLVSVLVNPGDAVKKDQPLVIMEAMKMEHTIKAPSDGLINTLYYAEGDMVDGGSELLDFSEKE